MNKLSLSVALALAACTSSHAVDVPDVVGPFTGQVHRYVVDHITLPTTTEEVRADGDDLDGDGVPDNQLGADLGVLDLLGVLSSAGDTLIGTGTIASSVEILADDLDDDSTVQVTYYGSASDTPIPVTGTLEGGVFRSNRTLTTKVPGRVTAVLPVFADADPSVLEIDGLELDLVPDGAGGFDALVRGGIAHASGVNAAAAGLLQAAAFHNGIGDTLDANHDGVLTERDVATSSIVTSLTMSDIGLYLDGSYDPSAATNASHYDSLSAGFAIHLIPCAAGTCTTPTTDTCHDRILDGDETDLDCGGSCDACPGGDTCAAGTDCQLGACDGGTCREPTCADGIQDGFESDVDCGDGCAPCHQGQHCDVDADCSTGTCNFGAC